MLSATGYDAWGASWRGDGAPADPFAYDARWGYVRDPETAYYYCRSRYYDPIGRWVTRDPIGQAGGINLYGYCGENPVGRADPSGLMLTAGLIASGPLHGNSAASPYSELYLRFDTSGEYYKVGISGDTGTRYPQTGPNGLNGGWLEIIARGTRRQMLDLENACIREYPGSGNNERFSGAGLKPGQVPFVDQLRAHSWGEDDPNMARAGVNGWTEESLAEAHRLEVLGVAEAAEAGFVGSAAQEEEEP